MKFNRERLKNKKRKLKVQEKSCAMKLIRMTKRKKKKYNNCIIL